MVNLTRRDVVVGSAAVLAGTVAGVTPASAFWFGLLGRALAGAAARTVVRGAVRRGVTALSSRAASRRAMAGRRLRRRGWTPNDIDAGDFLSDLAGDAASDASRSYLGEGWGIIGGGDDEGALGYFPNHGDDRDDVPFMGCGDAWGLKGIPVYLDELGLDFHQLTRVCYPLRLVQDPRYDGWQNTVRPLIYESALSILTYQTVEARSGYGHVRITCEPINRHLRSPSTYWSWAADLPQAFSRR
jgi:hypothetical protein